MCDERFCESCKKKNNCNGKIIDLYHSVRKLVCRIIQNKLEYGYRKANNIDPKCFFGSDYMLSIAEKEYMIRIEELVSVAFFYLLKRWTLSQGERKKYSYFLNEKYKKGWKATDINTLYKSRYRFIKKVAAENNVDFHELWMTNKEKFDYYEFLLKYRKNITPRDFDIYKIEHYRKFKVDLLSHMYTYSIPNSRNNYPLFLLREDLETCDSIYEEINSSESYFDKCLKYELFEHLTHYETAYKFVKILEESYSNLSDENKQKALQYETVLRHIKVQYADNSSEPILVEFPIFVNVEQRIHMFFQIFCSNNYKRPIECAELLLDLTQIVGFVVDECLDNQSDKLPNFPISECTFAENIFKNYIGQGQHITKNKDLGMKVLKKIISIFDKSEYMD